MKKTNSENLIIWLGNVCPTKTRDNPNQGRVYSTDGVAPTLNSMLGGQSSTYGFD